LKIFATILFVFLFSISFAQKVELAGAVIIGNSEMVTYKIVFEINEKNLISGYSISDIGGALETKAKISGFYNPQKKSLKFDEISLISSKTNLSANEFCFLKVKGRFSTKKNIYVFSGSFVSKGQDAKLVCDSGSIYLTTTEEIYRLEEKVQKIIAKSSLPDSVSNIISEKIKPLKAVEQVKTVKAGSVTEYILLADTIKLEIYDDQKQDGDKITILKNNIPVLTDFLTTNAVQKLSFDVAKSEKELVLTIISTDEGNTPPNTVKLLLVNGVQKVKIIAPLKKNQKISLKLVRR